MKNKIYLIIFILYILSIAQADDELSYDMGELQYWSWMNCRETLKKYSIYRESTPKDTQDKEDKYFKCVKEWTSIEYREKCEKNKEPLADITKSFFHECNIPYQDIKIYRKEFTVCGKESDICYSCKSDQGKSAGCKTIESKSSDKQVEYNTFLQNYKETCQIDTKCPNDLGSYAQQACQITEENQCKVDWLSKNSPKDPCLSRVLCLKSLKSKTGEKSPIDGQNQDNNNSFSIIIKLSLFMSLAMFLIL